ncbi:hypothetical protein N0V90_000146 [Kalmusia sp. IMI 367209]|nr:hypothetical protein N0V90_000146 [Kalmusia sp. IMI 367209]
MAIFSFANIAISLVSLWIARRIYWETTTGARRRALAKQHGCLSAKKLQTVNIFLGIDHIVRNFRAYRQNRLLESWTQLLTERNTHTIAMDIAGQRFYITNEPENVKTMLSTNFDHWSIGRERITQMSSYLGHGIFTTEGAAWKHSREMLRPCFERSQVADISILEKHTDRLIEQLPKDGTTVDLQPLFHQLTLDIATEFLFGRSTDALDRSREDKMVHEFIEAFEYCENPFSNQNNERWGMLGMFLPDSKFKKCAKVIQDFADKLIEEEISTRATTAAQQAPTKRYVFLDGLLSQTQDRNLIRAELLNILLAGRDTTASLLSNLLFEIPRHPDILARLHREIVSHVGDTVPTYQQLKEMKYLKAVMSESQRLYPIVPTNSREALKDTVLPRGGGPDSTAPILVPKSALVAYHPYAMHRREDIYGEDTHSFDPTRWLDDERDGAPLRPGWGYIPFSGGPRVCIGQNFALTETAFVLVRLLQLFEVESRDEQCWREKLSIVCTGLGGCKVGLTAR